MSAQLANHCVQLLVQHGAYSFDGVDDRVDADDESNFSFGDGSTDSPFSLAAFVHIDTLTGPFFTKAQSGSREYTFGSFGSRIHCYIYDQSAGSYLGRTTATGVAIVGEWAHYTMTYDGSGLSTGIRIYKNGVRVDDTNVSSGSYTAMEDNGSDFSFGRADGGLGGPFNGKAFYALVYSKELSSDEVVFLSTLGRDGTNPTATNLVSQWKMNERSGTTSRDDSGNNYTGSITNASLQSFHVIQTVSTPGARCNGVGGMFPTILKSK